MILVILCITPFQPVMVKMHVMEGNVLMASVTALVRIKLGPSVNIQVCMFNY